MKIVTAPDEHIITDYDVSCFLAGGITGCVDWQHEVIGELNKYDNKYDLEDLIIFNPRREYFNTKDLSATDQQIAWEFIYLNKMDIFSVYFTKDTLQPIVLYELGRYIEVMKNTFPRDYHKRIIISIEPGYERTVDVILQTNLAFGNCIPIIWNQVSSYEKHAKEIVRAYKWVKNKDVYINF